MMKSRSTRSHRQRKRGFCDGGQSSSWSPRPPKDETPLVIALAYNVDAARPQLQEACDFGFLGDLQLNNGSTVTASFVGPFKLGA
jgi:hypothetical protein